MLCLSRANRLTCSNIRVIQFTRYLSTEPPKSNNSADEQKFALTEEIYGRTRVYNDQASTKWTYSTETTDKSSFFMSYMRSMFLPIQYPSSVHPTYLRFHAWQATETYISAIVSVLCNQAMLHSLGLNHEAATAGAAGIAAGAAVGVNWILKDGIGEIGKLGFIASASRSFDSNPKTWKAVGEVLTTIGSGLQLCTLLSPPSYFLPLASGGNIAKSIAWALWGTTHMWFTRHFALSNNIGDLTGKSESQSAFALITGWFSGILLISYSHTPLFLFSCYFGLVPLHALATYKLLKSVKFEVLGQARACWLCNVFVREGRIVNPTDKMEGVGLFGEFLKKKVIFDRSSNRKGGVPKIHLGSSLDKAFGTLSDAFLCIEAVRGEDYLLGFGDNPDKYGLSIVLHKEAEGRDVFKALLHALKFHSLMEQTYFSDNNTEKPISYSDPGVILLLRQSHQWTTEHFPAFVTKLEQQDWTTDTVSFDDPGYRVNWQKQPKESVI